MLDLFRKWFTPGVQLETADLRATVRFAVLLALLVFLAVLALAAVVVFTSHHPTAVEDQAPDALVRLLTSVGVWGVLCLAAYAAIQAWDNTMRAVELLHVASGDEPVLRAAKILGSVLIDSAILLAAALVFGRVVGL